MKTFDFDYRQGYKLKGRLAETQSDVLFYTMFWATFYDKSGEKLQTEKVVIENHVPLLDPNRVEPLAGLSIGLDLSRPSDQLVFRTRIENARMSMGVDEVLEYLVNNCDIMVGNVIPAIRLSNECNAARRIHWGFEQLKRYNSKQRNGRSVEAQVSYVMVGAA